jgi:hypothetical protein
VPDVFSAEGAGAPQAVRPMLLAKPKPIIRFIISRSDISISFFPIILETGAGKCKHERLQYR